MKQPRRTGASYFHYGFLPMAPGGAIGFVCGISAKGRVMLAQKGCFPRGTKMRNARRDAEIGRVE